MNDYNESIIPLTSNNLNDVKSDLVFIVNNPFDDVHNGGATKELKTKMIDLIKNEVNPVVILDYKQASEKYLFKTYLSLNPKGERFFVKSSHQTAYPTCEYSEFRRFLNLFEAKELRIGGMTLSGNEKFGYSMSLGMLYYSLKDELAYYGIKKEDYYLDENFIHAKITLDPSLIQIDSFKTTLRDDIYDQREAIQKENDKNYLSRR